MFIQEITKDIVVAWITQHQKELTATDVSEAYMTIYKAVNDAPNN